MKLGGLVREAKKIAARRKHVLGCFYICRELKQAVATCSKCGERIGCCVSPLEEAITGFVATNDCKPTKRHRKLKR